MPDTKNLCAQIPIELHNRVTAAREAMGQTANEYVTNLITEYFELKKNGGATIMANSRTMAFQIPEELFQRIKAHLERETARTGRKLTQREFVLSLIEEALNQAEQRDCFDHHVLIELLRRRIKDEMFLSLMWKFLKAGYMEQWEYHKTYSGTPQGSGMSPILANIYLSELDAFMEAYKAHFDKGGSYRKPSKEYGKSDRRYRKAKACADRCGGGFLPARRE